MPIELPSDSAGPRIPVLRRQRLGETFTGALVTAPERRDVLKKDPVTGVLGPVPKANGRGNRQELVVTMITIASTMAAGSGDDLAVPAPGDLVRTILRGGGYGAWIEATQGVSPHHVGDIIELTSTYAQRYDANGRPHGGQITTQEELDRVPRSNPVGVYGDITVRRATPADQAWVAKAEEAYHSLQQPTVLETAGAAFDADEF